VTSSFGEYRAGHYHGGLDFSTGGREGVPVQAPGNGFVFRLRASGIGYGRAVYFRLDDGRTVLYGHLSRFAPSIQSLVESVQDREGRYEVDFRPEAGSVSFRAGEILGYSGQSGAGPPHLHAEMRVGEDASVAVNPLGQGWSVPDTVAPRITRLRVEPAAAGVIVNGGTDPAVLEAAGEPAVRVSGPVHLWVECSDRTGAGSYRLAPYRVRAYLDDALESEIRLDRFHWNWAHEVEWTFDAARARLANERWICLQPPPGSHQDIARGDPRWMRSLSPGTHRLRVEAEDGNGNTDTAVFRCIVAGLPVAPEGHVPGQLHGLTGPRVDRTELVSRGAFLEARVADPQATARAESPNGEAAAMTAFMAPGGRVFQTGAPPSPGPWRIRAGPDTAAAVFHAVYVPGPSANSGTEGGPETERMTVDGCDLRIGRGATHGPLWITVQTGDRPSPGADGELMPVGPAVRLGPWAWPLRERIGVTLSPPSRGSRRGLGVFSRTQGGWSFEGADTTGPGVSAELAGLEDIALFRDVVPPRVRIDPYPPGAGVLTARIQDDGVGVSWRDIRMTLNAAPVVAEWDPEAKRLTGRLRRPPDPGSYTVVVDAADRLGNRTVQRLVFSVAP
jgi:hypothetical protein